MMNENNSIDQIVPETNVEICILFSRMLWEWAFLQRIACIKLCYEKGIISASNRQVCIFQASKTYESWKDKKIKSHKTLKTFQLTINDYLNMAVTPLPETIIQRNSSSGPIGNGFSSN